MTSETNHETQVRSDDCSLDTFIESLMFSQKLQNRGKGWDYDFDVFTNPITGKKYICFYNENILERLEAVGANTERLNDIGKQDPNQIVLELIKSLSGKN